MALVIVTGMSGAGKSIAINALEDMGYYCVDNLPSKFLVSFADLYGMAENKQEKKIATVVDIRGKEMFGDFFQAMEELSRRNYPYRILFLETDTQTLINRYKFTRRRHPLMEEGGLGMGEAIEREREFLKKTRLKADYIVDTSALKPMELRERVMSLLSEEPEREAMVIRVMSFGFREGIPSDADLVLDVRCLPNPYYLPELREHTGKEECIQKYILSFEESRTFLEKVKDMLTFLLPLYRKEGKGELVVAFGCTGGRHRSVCFAQLTGSYLEEQNNRVLVTHRELKEM
ncbi:MAG: RNase adapter RapZ [Lachnospiraceae bacterium]|nr:RNase adapter RapZ [Lachnospiraceae bacterium]